MEIVIWYMVIAERIEFTGVNRPDLLRSLPFHFGSLLATLSIRICTSCLLNLPMRRGSPRYEQGKSPLCAWKSLRISGMLIPSHRIGYSADFRILVQRPEARPKRFRSCCRLVMSAAIGLRNRTASSAYRLVRILTGLASKPAFVALSEMR
jgi:hypothetical protein